MSRPFHPARAARLGAAPEPVTGRYLAKQFIEAQHGRIWPTSAGEGKGASFFVELEEARPARKTLEAFLCMLCSIDALPCSRTVLIGVRWQS